MDRATAAKHYPWNRLCRHPFSFDFSPVRETLAPLHRYKDAGSSAQASLAFNPRMTLFLRSITCSGCIFLTDGVLPALLSFSCYSGSESWNMMAGKMCING